MKNILKYPPDRQRLWEGRAARLAGQAERAYPKSAEMENLFEAPECLISGVHDNAG